MRVSIYTVTCIIFSSLSVSCTKNEQSISTKANLRLQKVDSPILGNKILVGPNFEHLTKEEKEKIVKSEEEIYRLMMERNRLLKLLEN